MDPMIKRRINERFRKRKDSLFRKGNDLKNLCGAEVYILLYKANRFYVYTSSRNGLWPPQQTKVDESFPMPVIKSPTSFKGKPETVDKKVDSGQDTAQSINKADGGTANKETTINEETNELEANGEAETKMALS